MHIKSKITTVALLFVLLNINKAESQITINDVLGDYICNVNHWQTFTGPIDYTCTNTKLRLLEGFTDHIALWDSGCITNNYVFTGYITLQPDSTFMDGYVIGRYFENDSIYIKKKVGPDPDYFEYFGKKILGTGIVENKLQNRQAEIYPCPATTFINVKLPVFVKKMDYKICDLQNRLIKEGIFTQPENQLSVTEIPPGMYIIKFTGKEYIAAKKFIIQK